MNSERFNLNGALSYRGDNRIEEWIHEFLCGEGGNIAFSEGLKLEERCYYGPIKMPMKLFERCCGPEDGIKYQIDEVNFEKRVANMMDEIGEGWQVPPLIVNYTKGEFELNDGNHRYEALTRKGYEEYFVIIWITGEGDRQEFQETYHKYL